MSDNLIRNSQIRELRRRGVGPREIARRLGLSPSIVAGVLHRADMSVEAKGRGSALDASVVAAMQSERSAGRTLKAVADIFNVSSRTVQNYCRDVSPC